MATQGGPPLPTTVPREVRLIGGPCNGKVYTVHWGSSDVLYFVSITRVDVTTLDDVAKQSIPLTTKSAYRVRRISSSGHPVHNLAQQILFDYVGGA